MITASRDIKVKINEGFGVFPSLTFDLQVKADTLTLVSILHSHGIVPTVLLLCTDKGKNTQVPTQNNTTIPENTLTTQ